jgi:hypothetical protein
MDKKTSKNFVWILNGNVAIVTSASGKTLSLDLKPLIIGENVTPFEYYGIKQWLSDDNSSLKGDEKLNGIKLSYDKVINKGIQFAGNGQLRIVGDTRTQTPEQKQYATNMLIIEEYEKQKALAKDTAIIALIDKLIDGKKAENNELLKVINK